MMNKTANSMVTIHKINSAPFQFSPRLRKSILFVYFMVISLFNVLLANNIYWNSINGGNWSNPANWDTGTVPGSTDNVFITISGTYTVTLDADVTVASLSLGGSSGVQTLSADGRTLTLIGTGTVNSNGALHLINSIVTGSGPLTNNGNITVLGTANNAINLTFSNAVGATLRIEAGQPENAALTMANGFTNAGTIELINTHDNNWNYDATLNVTNGTLVNAAGGAILSQAGSNAGNRFLNAQLNNQGSLTVNWPLTIEKESAQHTNAGTITVSGGDLTINQFGTSPSFTNSGNIDIANGRTLTLSGGTVENASGGTFRGGGNLNVSATGLTNRGLIAPGASPGTFTITGDVMQDTTAVVEFEIDGYNDVQIDRLNITGNIALAGTLNVRFADSFVPWTGSVFPVMGYGSYSGSYTALQGLMTENFSSHLTFGESELTVVIDSSSASTVNLDSGLVAFYPFNGNADDGSGNGHHGVVYGATPATDRLGIPDQAFSFDGVNDEIDYDYFFPFHDTADAAISFWIRFTPEAHQSVFWTHPDDTDENRFHIFVNGNGTIGCDYREPDGTLHEIFGNGATGEGISVESDTWTNIVLTRQGNNYFLYKNDALVASAYRPLTNLPTSVGWQIAGRTDFHFNGLLDDVYLYNRALNPGEIHELYITGRPTINVVPGNLSVALEPDQTLTHTLTIGNSGQESLAFNISLAGHALDFDGADDYVALTSDISSANLPAREITLEAWVNLRNFNQWGGIIGAIQDNGGYEKGWALGTLNNTAGAGTNEFSFLLSTAGADDGDGALTFLSAGTAFNTNSWYHVAGTYDGDTMKLYINGELMNTSTAQSGDINYPANAYYDIGAFHDDNEFYSTNGQIDEVRVWNVARTQEQIQADMNRILNGAESGLVGYWQFNEGEGNTTADLSGQGLSGTLVNGPAWVVSGASLVSGWLSPEPITGIVPADSSVNVAVTFNSAGLDSGLYTANLVIASNDPENNEIQVPASLQVTIPNRAPVAVNDTIAIHEDMAALIAVLDNDSDPNGQTLVITGVSEPSYGTAAVNDGDATITYTPAADYYGADGFTYIVSDSQLADTAQVVITLLPVNDPPTLSQNLPDVTIDEDAFAAVVIPRLEDYFADVDENDHLTFAGTALDEGLDSLNIGGSGFRTSVVVQEPETYNLKRSRHEQNKAVKPDSYPRRKIQLRPEASTIKRLAVSSIRNNRDERSDTTALVVYPTDNFNGQIRVVITALDDSSASVRDTLVLTVQPVNDAPDGFALLVPTNGDTVDSIVVAFRWEASDDTDQDSVFYCFHLSGAGQDTLIDGLTDTSLSFDGAAFFDYDTVYSWYVDATDKADTTVSSSVFQFRTPLMLSVDQGPVIPEQYSLGQNYPNPFNPVTTIRYGLPARSSVQLIIYDLSGREVIRLQEGEQSVGFYQVTWNGRNRDGVAVSSGLYFYQIRVENSDGKHRYISTRRCVLLK